MQRPLEKKATIASILCSQKRSLSATQRADLRYFSVSSASVTQKRCLLLLFPWIEPLGEIGSCIGTKNSELKNGM